MKLVKTIFLAWLGAVCVTPARAAQTNGPSGPPSPPLSETYRDASGRMQQREPSPVGYFRKLLAMTPENREKSLASKGAAERRVILAKVDEYLALPADVREERLHQTEIHWEMIALMKMAPADRTSRLAQIFPTDRAMIDKRLAQWDGLPPSLHAAYLEKQEFLGFYLRWQASSPEAQKESIARLPDGRRARWTNQLAFWQGLPPSQRREMSDQFSSYLENGQQQQAAIKALSPDERARMEQSLRTFAQLPAASRVRCVKSFGKFAAMSPEERKEFLRNAERWESMTSEERGLWRQLVRRLPPLPPMPPGFETAQPNGLPPPPPGFVQPPMPPVQSAANSAPARLTSTAQTGNAGP